MISPSRVVKETIQIDAGRITFAVAMKNGDLFRHEIKGIAYVECFASNLYYKFINSLTNSSNFVLLKNPANGTEVAVRVSDIDKVINVERYEHLLPHVVERIVYDDIK